MNYPEYLQGNNSKISFDSISEFYREYLLRWYNYNNSEDQTYPIVVPVNKLEDYISEHMNPSNMWCAKGFVSAREVQNGDNLDFKNECGFLHFCTYVARVYFKFAVENDWINEDITEEEFYKNCHALQSTSTIPI